MRRWTVLSLAKIGAGCYQVADDYVVSKTADGWRWYDTRDLSVGGEWRTTRIEAVLDLEAHMSSKPLKLEGLCDGSIGRRS